MANRRKRTIEITLGIVRAFFEQPTWRQAELARRLVVRSETIRDALEAMALQDFPLERESDPPDVYWSVPRGTFGDGLLLDRDDVGELLRVLSRAPESDGRERLIRKLARSAPPSSRALPGAAWHPGSIGDQDELILRAIEDAIIRRTAVEIRYYSSHRGLFEWRVVSYQRVTEGVPVRTCAVCHRTDELRWFRLDGVADLRPSAEPFRVKTTDEVEAFIGASVDGFHDGSEPEEERFFVRDPEARWVNRNLLPPMQWESVEGGIVVRVRSSALMRVARYVVALGGAARPETRALSARVEELARGSLSALDQD